MKLFLIATIAAVIGIIAAMAQEPILSPHERTNLRNARLIAPTPLPPARETFNTALPVVSEHVSTQVVIMAIIQTITVRECMDVRFHRSNAWHTSHFPLTAPTMVSVTNYFTNHYENAAQTHVAPTLTR